MGVVARRIREKEARRVQILDAARDLFFTRGFEGTTIEDIAERTELSKGAIYLYFPSKEEIYVSITHEGSQILHQMLYEAASSNLPADTLLRRLGQTYFRFYKEYPGYFRMLFLYYWSPEMVRKVTPELCDDCEAQAKETLGIVAGIIQKGTDSGLFKSCNAWEFAIMTWTCQNGVILLGERGDDQLLKLETTVEKLHDLFLESIITSLKTGR
ncbi:TetR/AcrR family transcriptional regulator [bacterium]|nr:TetR/AcrR family transcriptional regulator [bacterium]